MNRRWHESWPHTWSAGTDHGQISVRRLMRADGHNLGETYRCWKPWYGLESFACGGTRIVCFDSAASPTRLGTVRPRR